MRKTSAVESESDADSDADSDSAQTFFVATRNTRRDVPTSPASIAAHWGAARKEA
jgi:hypothetical protein